MIETIIICKREDVDKLPKIDFAKDLLKNNQPERLNPEAHVKCAQCKIDDFHKETDPEMLNYQANDRLENPSKDWCTCRQGMR